VKNIYLLLTILCLSALANAQQKEKWHPFSNTPDLLYYLELGGFQHQIADKNAGGINFNAALSWNAHHAIGFTFGSTLNKFSPDFETDTAVYLKNSLTGLYYEYSWKPNEKVHLTFPMAVGAGDCYYDWRELDKKGLASIPYESVYYLYIEPAARVEMILNAKFRLVGGASYVFAPLEFNNRGLTQKDVSKPRYYIGVRFGKWWGVN